MKAVELSWGVVARAEHLARAEVLDLTRGVDLVGTVA